MNDPSLEILLSAYIDGEAAPEERARVEEALARDPELRRLRDEIVVMKTGLQGLPRERLDAGFAQRVLSAAVAKAAAAPMPAESATNGAASIDVEESPSGDVAPAKPRTTPRRREGRGAMWAAILGAAGVSIAASMFVVPLLLPKSAPTVARHTEREGGDSVDLAIRPDVFSKTDPPESQMQRESAASRVEGEFNRFGDSKKTADGFHMESSLAESAPDEATLAFKERAKDRAASTTPEFDSGEAAVTGLGRGQGQALPSPELVALARNIVAASLGDEPDAMAARLEKRITTRSAGRSLVPAANKIDREEGDAEEKNTADRDVSAAEESANAFRRRTDVARKERAAEPQGRASNSPANEGANALAEDVERVARFNRKDAASVDGRNLDDFEKNIVRLGAAIVSLPPEETPTDALARQYARPLERSRDADGFAGMGAGGMGGGPSDGATDSLAPKAAASDAPHDAAGGDSVLASKSIAGSKSDLPEDAKAPGATKPAADDVPEPMAPPAPETPLAQAEPIPMAKPAPPLASPRSATTEQVESEPTNQTESGVLAYLIDADSQTGKAVVAELQAGGDALGLWTKNQQAVDVFRVSVDESQIDEVAGVADGDKDSGDSETRVEIEGKKASTLHGALAKAMVPKRAPVAANTDKTGEVESSVKKFELHDGNAEDHAKAMADVELEQLKQTGPWRGELVWRIDSALQEVSESFAAGEFEKQSANGSEKRKLNAVVKQSIQETRESGAEEERRALVVERLFFAQGKQSESTAENREGVTATVSQAKGDTDKQKETLADATPSDSTRQVQVRLRDRKPESLGGKESGGNGRRWLVIVVGRQTAPPRQEAVETGAEKTISAPAKQTD